LFVSLFRSRRKFKSECQQVRARGGESSTRISSLDLIRGLPDSLHRHHRYHRKITQSLARVQFLGANPDDKPSFRYASSFPRGVICFLSNDQDIHRAGLGPRFRPKTVQSGVVPREIASDDPVVEYVSRGPIRQAHVDDNSRILRQTQLQ
jgi:hypothetical protein